MSDTRNADDLKPRPSPAWVAWLSLILLAHCAWMLHIERCTGPSPNELGLLATRNGDHVSYVGAMDNLVEHGEYFFLNANDDKVVAGRLPHYAAPYYMLRLVMEKSVAADVVAVLQVLMVAFAIWLLGILLAEVTASRWMSRLFMLTAAGSGHLAPFVHILAPEAASLALLCVAMYAFWRTEERNKPRDRWVLATALGCLIVLKPYFAPLLGLVALRWWWRLRDLRSTLRRCLLLGLPTLLLLAPWWIRNARLFDHFFPFQQNVYAGYFYDEADLQIRRLLATMGEDPSTWWEPGNLACEMSIKPTTPCTYMWPSHLSAGLYDELVAVRDGYRSYQHRRTPEATEAMVASTIRAEERFRSEHPWRTRFSRVLLTRAFLINSGAFHLPVRTASPCFHPVQMLAKAFAGASYAASLLGVAALILLAAFGKAGHYRFYTVPAAFLIILFPVILALAEPRYFFTVFAIDLWCLLLVCHLLIKWQCTTRPNAVSEILRR